MENNTDVSTAIGKLQNVQVQESTLDELNQALELHFLLRTSELEQLYANYPKIGLLNNRIQALEKKMPGDTSRLFVKISLKLVKYAALVPDDLSRRNVFNIAEDLIAKSEKFLVPELLERIDPAFERMENLPVNPKVKAAQLIHLDNQLRKDHLLALRDNNNPDFYPYLISRSEQLLRHFDNEIKYGTGMEATVEQKINVPIEATKINLNQRTIGLIHFYLNAADPHTAITKGNMKDIAAKFGWVADNSGQKIKSYYDAYKEFPTNRYNIKLDKKSDIMFKNIFESTLKYLSDNLKSESYKLAAIDCKKFMDSFEKAYN